MTRSEFHRWLGALEIDALLEEAAQRRARFRAAWSRAQGEGEDRLAEWFVDIVEHPSAP